MTYFLSLNVQLDRYDGTNYTHWKGKLFFLLTVPKIAYVLDPNSKTLSEPKEDNSDQVKTKKEESMIFTIRCYLQKEIGIFLSKGKWNRFVYKYIIEKKGTSKSLFFTW